MKITLKYPAGSPADIAKLPPLAEYRGENPVYAELLGKKIRTTDVEKLFPGEEWAAFLVEDDEERQWYPWKGIEPAAYDEHGARVVPPTLPPVKYGRPWGHGVHRRDTQQNGARALGGNMETRPRGAERRTAGNVGSRDGGCIRLARGPLILSTVAPLVNVAGRLSLTLCPGRKGRSYDGRTHYAHDLGRDVEALRAAGVTLVVSLLEGHEYADLDVLDLGRLVARAGILRIQVPVPDGGLPPDETLFAGAVHHAASAMRHRGHVVVHCRAGLGRSGLFAGCVLRALGVSGQTALTLLRAARGVRCPETQEQRDAILGFRFSPL
jgi:protein-tyrosine phosphatase